MLARRSSLHRRARRAALAGLACTGLVLGTVGAATPASAMLPDHRAPAALLEQSYGPGYSPNLAQEDSYYPTHGGPGIDALSYDLSAKWYPKSKSLSGTATIRFRAVENAPSFTLDLHQSLDVSSVKMGLLDDATFTRSGKDLVIANPVKADETYDVTIAYSGTPTTVNAPTDRVDMPRVGWHVASNGQAWTTQEPFGAYTWYPVNDLPADKATYSVRLDVPDEWVGISNGTMTRATVGDRTVTTFSNAHPIAPHLVTVAIGDYRKYTQTGPHGLPLTYWYPTGKGDLVDPLKRTPAALTWLEGKLGRYPFERLGVVLTPGDAAVSSQSMVTFGRGSYRYGNRDVRQTLVHQLVKQWYGGTTTPADWRDHWMDEGMATYLEARYATAQDWKPWSFWKQELNRNDVYWRTVYGPPGAYAANRFGQRNITYPTARMLLRLRDRIGATRFDSAMKAWPQTHLDSTKVRAGYISWLEERTGKELSSFFGTELNDVRPTL